MLTLIIFLAVLSVLVFVHEFGHFITAKRSGARVDEFGFGFPPRLVGWKRGDTTYSINWIPMGGFVKIKGEDGEGAGERDSFASLALSRRAVIVAAGVVMNFLLAAVLLSFGFGFGVPSVLEQVPASARVRDSKVYAANVLSGTPAARAGMAAGDIIRELAGEPVRSAELFREQIKAAAGKPVRIMIERSGQRREIVATPEILAETGKPGIGVGLLETGIVSYPWYEAPYRGAQTTVFLTGEIVRSFGQLLAGFFRGRVEVDFSGPVGIAVLTGEVAKLGLVSLLQFMALLSVNLAVVNLIPFPALDGGRLLFFGIEKLRGRPVPKRWENTAHRVGFALLIVLVIVVTVRDVGRFGGPLVQTIKNLVQ